MIFHDPRHGSKVPGHRHSHDIGDLLTALGVEVEVVSLGFGDFVFIGNGPEGPVKVGIELKTAAEFITAMASGRLAGHQVPGLVRDCDRAYLVIQGSYRVGRGGVLHVDGQRRGGRPLFMRDVERFIVGLEESGLRVRYTKTSKGTARLIVDVLYAFWQKPYEDHTSIGAVYTAPHMQLVPEDEVTQRIRRVCVDLKAGLGYTRSKAVAQHFRSIIAMVNSPEEGWKGIEGIGMTTARGVMKACREEIPVSKASARGVRERAVDGDSRLRHGRRYEGPQVDTRVRAVAVRG